MPSVLQDWVNDLSMMQQSVLLTAVRGPDGLPKYHPSKYLLRWFRRCILLSAMDGKVLEDPFEPNGGSFTGPSVVRYPPLTDRFDQMVVPEGFEPLGQLRDGSSHQPDGVIFSTCEEAMNAWVTAYIRDLDEVPHHFQLHLMHAVEIVGYKHPVPETAGWWLNVYHRLVKDMHLEPELEGTLDHRLGDNRAQWLAHGDEATEA